MHETKDEYIKRLEREAYTDPLTGLLNRRGFTLKMARGSRSTEGYAYVAIDLNGFKAAQDAHPAGHAYGDDVLRSFADYLTRNTRQGRAGNLYSRPKDIICARPGGDEFLVAVPLGSDGSPAGAHRIADLVAGWSYGNVTATAAVGWTIELADQILCVLKRARRAAAAAAPTPARDPGHTLLTFLYGALAMGTLLTILYAL